MAAAAAALPTPRTVLTYPLAAAPSGGALLLFGKSDAPSCALICAGYPDDHDLILPFAARLATEAECLVGVACLPGYDDRDDFPYGQHKSEGYTFDEIVSGLREAAKALRRESTCKGEATFTGIFHDWGVAFGLMFTNRCLEEGNEALCPDRLVLFDVLTGPHPEATDVPMAPDDTHYETAVALSYRFALAASFAIRLHLSKLLAQIFIALAFLILSVLQLVPTYDIDANVIQQRQRPIPLDRAIYMAYPYYRAFLALLGGKQKVKEVFHGCHLPKDLKKTPVLFIYGTEKRIMFHDKAALAMLERQGAEIGKSRAVAVDGAGHWLYVQRPDVCMSEVVKFMRDA